jgi:putative heme-binding domain-containing protein
LISSLFEAFVPARLRQRRLGPNATYAEIADLRGNPTTGEAWFFDLNKSQCAKCHRVGLRGGQVGPDLLHVGTKLTPPQLFESIVDPSRIIEPKYQSHSLLLTDGNVITGLLDHESETQLTLINAKGEKVTVEKMEIESRKLDSVSIMPTGLGSELTAQQAADLIAYLSGLK